MAARPARCEGVSSAGFSLKNQQLWRHQWCRVDSVAACRCTDARCLMQLRVGCCNSCSQLSHGSASSSNDGCVVMIMNGRVPTGMVANALLHGVLVLQSPGDAGSAGHDGSASGRIRLWPGPVRTQTSATHAKTHRASRTSTRAPLAAPHQTRAASRADATPKAAPRDGLRITKNHLAVETGSRSRPSPAAPTQGSLEAAAMSAPSSYRPPTEQDRQL